MSLPPPPPQLGERTLGTNWLGDWVGPTGGVDVLEKRKNSLARNPVIIA